MELCGIRGRRESSYEKELDNQGLALRAVVEALIVDLLQWLSERERTYEEAMDAWRTSCPKLPVWEDANDLGLVERQEIDGRSIVRVTGSGQALLRRR